GVVTDVRNAAHGTDGGGARRKGVLVGGLGEDVAETAATGDPPVLTHARVGRRPALRRRVGRGGARAGGGGGGPETPPRPRSPAGPKRASPRSGTGTSRGG